MSEKLKELKEKLNPKVAVIGGALVISTSLGTCHLMGDEPAAPEAIEEASAAPETTPAEPKAEEKSKTE